MILSKEAILEEIEKLDIEQVMKLRVVEHPFYTDTQGKPVKCILRGALGGVVAEIDCDGITFTDFATEEEQKFLNDKYKEGI